MMMMMMMFSVGNQPSRSASSYQKTTQSTQDTQLLHTGAPDLLTCDTWEVLKKKFSLRTKCDYRNMLTEYRLGTQRERGAHGFMFF